MALAGDHHVVVAVDAQLDRLLQLERGQGRALAEDAGIALFAPKTAAHAAANHFHVIGGQVQGRCGLALVAIRVLGGHVQSELPVFARHSVGDVAFQVKLLLLSAVGLALQAVGRAGQSGAGVTPIDALGGHDKTLLRHGFINGQNGWQFAHCHLGAVGGFAGINHFARHHHGHGLAQKFHFAIGQKRVVMDDGPAVVFAGNIAGGEHRHHAVLGEQSGAVNALADQLAMGHWGLDQGGIQGAAQLGDVIGVHRLTGDVQMGRFVDQLCALHTGRQQLAKGIGCVHGQASTVWLSSMNCNTRLRATKAR